MDEQSREQCQYASNNHRSAAQPLLVGVGLRTTGTGSLYSRMTPVRQTGAPPTGLATPLQYVKGVGPQRATLLGKKGLATIEDALFFLPIRHEDRTRLTPLRAIQVGQVVTCSGTIAGISPPPPGRARVPLVLLLRDASGYGTATLFGRGWLMRVLQR